ncbi:hypothetical protein BD410DRAFT_279598 [Rickenella mellea]|uniref:Uncharacterized protein n=1 Tax=Rickenella mellea TaxID=50990 RepID=A0A4Y7Q3S6_9AGAM|nr:hypothetical protein BD410DRAFT_279598 [Rickenella mellea]
MGISWNKSKLKKEPDLGLPVYTLSCAVVAFIFRDTGHSRHLFRNTLLSNNSSRNGIEVYIANQATALTNTDKDRHYPGLPDEVGIVGDASTRLGGHELP